jgi:phosphatidylserine decarboxylase
VKHKGKAARACLEMIFWSLVALLTVTVLGFVAALVGTFVVGLAGLLFGVWVLFALLCLWFFRDPDPQVPLEPDLILAPAHGKVDIIDELTEPEFMGGPCRRVSIFLSLFDVHVQNAPVAGRIALVQPRAGQFLSALRAESALRNENVLLGLESRDRPGERLALRLIAGVLARRIVPWVGVGDEVARGERLSLIRFGSRVDLYLPTQVRLEVKVGDRVRGGETIVARRVGGGP